MRDGKTANRCPGVRAALLWALAAVTVLGLSPSRGWGSPAAAMSPVAVPSSALLPPARVFVLPVVLVPADQLHLVEAGTSGRDLVRRPMRSSHRDEFRRGRQNLGIFLRMAQRKYRAMLRHPTLGTDRGTFRLASWQGRAVEVRERRSVLQPLVVRSALSRAEMANAYAAGEYPFLAEVLAAVDCRQGSCPFVFAIAAVGEPIHIAGGRKLNHGYDSGGGFAIFNFRRELVEVDRAGSPVHFFSTLLHELGHAFGLPHVSDFCGDTAACPARLSINGSPSVMSYNSANWIYGCGHAQSSSNPSDGACTYPGDAVIDALPGSLIAEDLRILSQNDRVFPGLVVERPVDAPGLEVFELSGLGDTPIPGHQTLELLSAWTHEGFWTPPSVLLGGDDNPMPQFFDPFDGIHMWHSKDLGPQGWAVVSIAFPEEVDLRRIDVYSGYGSGTHRAKRVRVRAGSSFETAAFFASANQTIPFKHRARVFHLWLQAGDSGHVVLRGVRLFGEVEGTVREIYPAAEPRVVATSVGTWGGGVENVVGSDQSVRLGSKAFEAASSWHPQAVTPGAWVSLTVEFPQEVELGLVKVHTGHSGGVHRAREVQVERRCFCGVADAAACAASTVACSGQPVGSAVFEFLRRTPSGADELVSFASRRARTWKVALRTPTAAEQPDHPGFVALRGLRFFLPSGLEIFPARFVDDGL
ncbi:MAG: hypothetical protein AAF604_02865 [Acidobacteriota bacterium]